MSPARKWFFVVNVMTAKIVNRRVLIVDDNESIHDDFQQILAGSPKDHRSFADCKQAILGSTPAPTRIPPFELQSAYQGQDGLQLVSQANQQGRPFSIAFVDGRMPPGWDGVETAARILAVDPNIQIVLCTAFSDHSLADILERFGTNDRVMMLQKPFDVVATCLLAVSLSEKWRLTHEANARLNRQATQITDARRVMAIIESCLDELESGHDELRHHAVELTGRLQQRTVEVLGTRDLAMFALAQLADSRDPETGEHLLRMRAYAQLLAEHLIIDSPYSDQLDKAFLEDFYRSTPLHDIGKVGIPDQILLKPGRLTVEEFEIMKQHTVIGAEALEKAAKQNRYGTFLTMAAEIARWHHERFDGRGYPDGLSGQSIPLSARITALADVFDALTSSRVYKDAIPADESRRIIEEQDGQQFDPVVVAAFRACYDEFLLVKDTIDNGSQSVDLPLVSFDQPLPLFARAEAVDVTSNPI